MEEGSTGWWQTGSSGKTEGGVKDKTKSEDCIATVLFSKRRPAGEPAWYKQIMT